MIESLSFPGLGLEFEVDRVAFYLPDFLGGLAIYWYGVIIAAAFLAAILYAMSRVREFGLDKDRAFDVLMMSVLAGMAGARIYYVLFTLGNYHSFKDIIYTRNGGVAIYGGIIAGVFAGALLCKLKKIKILPMLDLAAGSLILGQAIGRWGNFVNIEAFGSNTTLPWGMASPVISSYLASQRPALEAIGIHVDPAMPVHPTFLYESLWCLAGFLLIMRMTKKRRFDGQLSLFYLFWYGMGRFFIEGLRTDSLLLGNVRISQMVALLCVLSSAITLAAVLSRIKKEGNSVLYVDTEEGQAVLSGEFYKKKQENPADAVFDSNTGQEGPSPEGEGPVLDDKEESNEDH